MKQNAKYWLLLFALIAITSCSNPMYGRIAKAIKQQEFTVTPHPLKRTGNEVTFTMSVTVAQSLLPFSSMADTEYIFDVMYVPGDVTKFVERMRLEGEIQVGSFSFKGKDYLDSKKTPTQTKTMRFDYQEKYQKGYLVYYLFVHKSHLNKRVGPYLVTSNGKAVTGIIE
ncbi:hypothetical protein BKI52_15090 [marine bacterium AO1-C]|nr:hypothetical protein BKI52_15090 [marine bacterium AO1-C]